MVGPASAGKTTLARLFGETVRLPVIEIPPNSVRSSRELYDHIAVTLERHHQHRRPQRPLLVEDGPARSGRVRRPYHASPALYRLHRRGTCVAEGRAGRAAQGDRVEGPDAVHRERLVRRLPERLLGRGDDRAGQALRTLRLPLHEGRAGDVRCGGGRPYRPARKPDWNLPLCHLVAQYAGRVPGRRWTSPRRWRRSTR